jgi:hypothetical protein
MQEAYAEVVNSIGTIPGAQGMLEAVARQIREGIGSHNVDATLRLTRSVDPSVARGVMTFNTELASVLVSFDVDLYLRAVGSKWSASIDGTTWENDLTMGGSAPTLAAATLATLVARARKHAAGDDRETLDAGGIEMLKRFTHDSKENRDHVILEVSAGARGAPLLRFDGFHITYSAADRSVLFVGCTGTPGCPPELKGMRFTATLSDIITPYMDRSDPRAHEPSRIVRLRAMFVAQPAPRMVFFG